MEKLCPEYFQQICPESWLHGKDRSKHWNPKINKSQLSKSKGDIKISQSIHQPVLYTGDKFKVIWRSILLLPEGKNRKVISKDCNISTSIWEFTIAPLLSSGQCKWAGKKTQRNKNSSQLLHGEGIQVTFQLFQGLQKRLASFSSVSEHFRDPTYSRLLGATKNKEGSLYQDT